MIEHNNNFKIMDNVFGISRIVDAKNKKIISLDNKNNDISNHRCFEFWETKSECINCISMRALNENKSFSKIETINDRLYYIISSPINVNSDRYVLELVKDITEDDIRSFLCIDVNTQMKEEIIRLNKLLVTDDLTKTFNRRYINEKLPYSLQKFRNNELTLSIIMLDLDKFKSINDTYGHDCGDFVLIEVSKVLLDFVTKHSGWVARYGGDEFIIVIENLSKEETETISQTLKEVISNMLISYNEENINITCSLGISYPCMDNLNIEIIVKDADINLYESKKNLYSV